VSSYNTVSGNNITNSATGVYLSSSSNNTFSGNTITNNTYGVRLLSSSNNNTVSGNTITNSTYGVGLSSSSNNTFYHNNFVDNTQQVYIATPGYPNFWNSSYPSGGNYWSNYAGVDLYSGLAPQDGIGSDGIGDTPHVIDGDNQDNYPFMGQNGWQTHPFTIESNVTITDRRLTTSTLDFNVSGPSGLLGYINVTMPMGLNTTEIRVFFDGELIPPPFPIITNNSTHYFIYFEFTLSTHAIVIQYGPVLDVAVTNVTPSKTVVGQSYSMHINVTVQNQGDYIQTFNVTVYYNDTAITMPNGKPYQTVTIASGDSTTITFTWNTTGVAYGNYTITAKATPVPGETDTLDNMRTCWVVVTIQGDVDGDYIVDGSDLFDLNEAYGSTLESPNWNPNCDLDNNNKVDALDLFELSKNYGKTNPEVFFSTLAASASMIVALVAYVALKTLRKKRAQD